MLVFERHRSFFNKKLNTMKNRAIFVVFFIYLNSSASQENLGFLPASQRLLPSYDSLYDKAYKQDMQTIITAKQALLVFMDSLESIFCEKFTYIPHVKFEIPESKLYDNTTIAGAYRGKDKTIYFNHVFGIQMHNMENDIENEYLQKNFDTTAVHELSHWYHDLLIGRITGQYLGEPENLPLLERIEYEIIVEGIAIWITHKYFGECYNNAPTWYFPINNPSAWRDYGFNLLRPILDRFGKRGLEYLVLNPFQIKNKKSISESALKFQEQAMKKLGKDK